MAGLWAPTAGAGPPVLLGPGASAPAELVHIPLACKAASSTDCNTGTHIAFPQSALVSSGEGIGFLLGSNHCSRRHSVGVIRLPREEIQCPCLRENVRHGDLSL